MKRLRFEGFFKRASKIKTYSCSACGQTRLNSNNSVFSDEYNIMFEGRPFNFIAGKTYEVADNIAEFLLSKYSYSNGQKIPAFTELEKEIKVDEPTGKLYVSDDRWKTIKKTLDKYFDEDGNILALDGVTYISKSDKEAYDKRFEEVEAIYQAYLKGALELNYEHLAVTHNKVKESDKDNHDFINAIADYLGEK